MFRSSHLIMFFRIGVLRIFANFAATHLRWSLFLIKLQTFMLRYQLFSCEICEIFRNTFFYRTPPVAVSDESKTRFSPHVRYMFQQEISAKFVFLTLIWVGGNFTQCWFSLYNSEVVKAITLAFCSIQ